MLAVKWVDLINNLINSDIKNLSMLAHLQDTQLDIEILDLKMQKSFFFSESGFRLDIEHSKNFSLMRIQGDVQSFLTLLISKNPKRATQQGLIFEGEAKALQSLQQLLLNMTIDWQAVLLAYANEVPWVDAQLSHILVHTIKQFLAPITPVSKAYNKFETLSITISDYIQDEKNWVPNQREIKDFMGEVDEIRSAVERCEARIDALRLNAKRSKQGMV